MDNRPKFVGDCPAKCVEEGSEQWHGHVHRVHHRAQGVYADVQDEIECQIVTKQYNKKTVGDPSI